MIGSPTESTSRSRRLRSVRICTSASHQAAVVLFQFLPRAPEVGDVAQHRDDGGACRVRATCAR